MTPFWQLLSGILLLLPCACVAPVASNSAQQFNDMVITQDTVWQGQIVVSGRVEVLRDATLTILPGTEVAFERRDDDGDWLGDSTLLIKGALIAVGTRAAPIVFRSAAVEPKPGDWKEIRADFARKLILRHSEIRDSVAGLHAHYTNGVIEDCWLHRNIDGARFGAATASIRNCLIEENEAKGVLTRASTLQVENNIFRNNGVGLFFMEEDRASRVEQNNFYANNYHLRLGDFSNAKIETANNWLGSADATKWRSRIYDQQQNPELGTITAKPAAGWRSGTGPRDQLQLQVAWQFATAGFIDASPLIVGETLYTASWDGNISALDPQGRLLWQQSVGAEVDAALASDGKSLFIQNWERRAVALDLVDGEQRWSFVYPESPADDHRQGGLVPLGELVLLPAWGGTLYALDGKTGQSRWQYGPHLPLRAAPVAAAEQIYLSGGDGSFTALDLTGQVLWSTEFAAPLLASAAITPDGPVVVDRDGLLSAFTAAGQLRWQRRLAELCYYSAPRYYQGAIYLATAAGSLWKFDAVSGAPIWHLSDLGAIYGSPLLVGRRLFIGTNSGQLLAINIDSAEILAKFQAGRDIQTTPTLFSGRLIFGSRDSKLYALDLVDGFPPEVEK